jgi:hypothetical protein
LYDLITLGFSSDIDEEAVVSVVGVYSAANAVAPTMDALSGDFCCFSAFAEFDCSTAP